MLYHDLNNNNMYTHDPDISLNKDYYTQIYDDSEFLI